MSEPELPKSTDEIHLPQDDILLYETTDGHTSLSIHDSSATIGEGVYSLVVADGGGFASLWVNKNTLKELKEALEKILESK